MPAPVKSGATASQRQHAQPGTGARFGIENDRLLTLAVSLSGSHLTVDTCEHSERPLRCVVVSTTSEVSSCPQARRRRRRGVVYSAFVASWSASKRCAAHDTSQSCTPSYQYC